MVDFPRRHMYRPAKAKDAPAEAAPAKSTVTHLHFPSVPSAKAKLTELFHLDTLPRTHDGDLDRSGTIPELEPTEEVPVVTMDDDDEIEDRHGDMGDMDE